MVLMLLPPAARTSLALTLAGSAIVVAALLAQRSPSSAPSSVHTNVFTSEFADDGMQLSARFTTGKTLVGSHDEDLAIAITAPGGRAPIRPPLSVAVVIDRSGSMEGAPIANAKAAAAQLVDRLDDGDAFTIITYSSGDETVMAMSRATPANKAAAHAAIAQIHDDGGTCISCGLERGARELAHTPIVGGLTRMVLISDGQANEGVYDRGDLAQLAANTAARGMSISTVGVGLEFDEITMQQLAQVGRGNYYFVEDTARLGAMFDRELGGLAETVAAGVNLSLVAGPGVEIVEAYGYQTAKVGNATIIPVADLRAGESRKIVLRVHVATTATGSLVAANVFLNWQRVSDRQARRAQTSAVVDVVNDPNAVAASVDAAATLAVEQARTAHALDEATAIYERDGYDAARRVLDARMQTMHANRAIAPAEAQKLDATYNETIGSFAKAPAASNNAATKATRERAYNLAR